MFGIRCSWGCLVLRIDRHVVNEPLPMRRGSLGLCLVLLFIWVPTCAAAQYEEHIVSVPVTGTESVLAATVYRPLVDARYPLVVVSHGSPPDPAERQAYGYWRKPALIDALIRRGFAVMVPIRRGFGATGGDYLADFGGCTSPGPDFHRASLAAAEDIVASVDYARRLPFVRPDRIVLIGQSAGGIASLAAAALKPEGVVAVANFSAGRGGDPSVNVGRPCFEDLMAQTIARHARSTDVPVLWFYAENDRFFAPPVVRKWFDAFSAGGGKGHLVIVPPFGRDGHDILLSPFGQAEWGPAFDVFMQEHGLP